MTEKILIATRNRDDQVALKRLVGERGPEIIGSTAGQDALKRIAAAKPDLVLLDISLPDISGYELCRIIKSDPKLRGASVILLAAKNQLDHSEMYRARADSSVIWPTTDPALVDLARNKLLQFLLHDRLGSPWSQQTLILLDLMTHRAASIICEELADTLDFSTQIVSETPLDPNERVDQVIVEAIRQMLLNTEFIATLGSRCLRELPALLWTEIGEQLIRDRRCRFSEFGQFDVIGSGGAVKIDFAADPPIADSTLPQIEVDNRISHFAASNVRLTIGRILRRELFPQLVANKPNDPGFETVANVLQQSIGPILRQFSNAPEILDLSLERVPLWSGRERRKDLFGLLGQAAANAAYCCFVVEFSRSLLVTPEIEIKALGTFTRGKLGVRFEAADSFLRLLRANLPQGQGAGA